MTRELRYWIKFVMHYQPIEFRAPNYMELFIDVNKHMERYGFIEWMIQG